MPLRHNAITPLPRCDACIFRHLLASPTSVDPGLDLSVEWDFILAAHFVQLPYFILSTLHPTFHRGLPSTPYSSGPSYLLVFIMTLSACFVQLPHSIPSTLHPAFSHELTPYPCSPVPSSFKLFIATLSPYFVPLPYFILSPVHPASHHERPPTP